MPFTEIEKKYIVDNYAEKSADEILAKLQISDRAMLSRFAHYNGLKKSNRISEADKKYIAENIDKLSVAEIAKKCNVQPKSIYTYISRNEIAKTRQKTKGKIWSQDEIEIVQTNINKPVKSFEHLLPLRSNWAIYAKVRELNNIHS